MGSIVSSILTGLHFSTSGIGSLIAIAQKAPQAIDAAEEIAGTAKDFVPVAQTLYGDLTKIIQAGESGKWTEEPDDIAKISADIQAAWGKTSLKAKSVAAAAKRLVSAI